MASDGKGISSMGLSQFIFAQRYDILLRGDYDAYRSQLTRRLLSLRRKLGRTTPKGKKYTGASPVTAKDVASSHEFAHLLLLTAERAWAHAMLIKEERSATPGPRALHRPVRKHIISRLRRACKTAQALCHALGDQVTSSASNTDILEAHAYAFLVEGAWQFERQRWRESLVAYAVARIIYTVIMTTSSSTAAAAKSDASSNASANAATAAAKTATTVMPAPSPESIFRELFSNQIDPSMRYASYKAALPPRRTVTGLARRALLQCDARLVPMLEQLDAAVFSPAKLTRQAQKQPPSAEGAATNTTTAVTGVEQLMSADGSGGDGGVRGVGAPQAVAWRGRTVRVDDAGVAVALAAASAASAALGRFFAAASAQRLLARDKAAAYDGVLSASHDAVEATKRAAAVLARAGVGASDARMQALLVARTATEYALVGWRVGRNRTLAGYRDGLASEDPRLGKKEHLRRVARQAKRRAAASTATAAAAAVTKPTNMTTTAMTAATAPKKTGSSTAKGLATLRERVALYDGILQSIDSVKDLPGVAADEAFLNELQAYRSYYQALKCLAIARAHSLLSAHHNALALLLRASALLSQAQPLLRPDPGSSGDGDAGGDDTGGQSGGTTATATTTTTADPAGGASATAKQQQQQQRLKRARQHLHDQTPPALEVDAGAARVLRAVLEAELVRQHALAELAAATTTATTAAAAAAASTVGQGSSQPPQAPSPPLLVETLGEYPGGAAAAAAAASVAVNVGHLVAYPPRLEPVPVKPLFLDVAWNYIDYPGRYQQQQQRSAPSSSRRPSVLSAQGQQQPQQKHASSAAATSPPRQEEEDGEEEQAKPPLPPPPEKKRGWFGFGR